VEDEDEIKAADDMRKDDDDGNLKKLDAEVMMRASWRLCRRVDGDKVEGLEWYRRVAYR
jgi:hypothetical protein